VHQQKRYRNGGIILDKAVGQLMQTKTTITRKLTVPAAKAWDAITKIGRLDVWFPTISSCVVEGSGVGAIRRMDLARGGKIVDHIVDVRPEKMRLTYERVESPFAVTSYRGTVEVFESFDGLGVVVWTIDFESTPENSPLVNAQLEAGIGAGLEGMKADLAAAT
jgi:hypothetical protein